MIRRAGNQSRAPKPCPACRNSGRKGKIKVGEKDKGFGKKEPIWQTCKTCHGNGTVSSRD